MKLVIVDRDGTLNHDSPDYIKSPDECRPIPGSLEAVARLGRGGYSVAVATNQAGIGRGLFAAETLAAIHAKLQSAAGAAGGQIAGFFHCPHTPEALCACRKPQPGLLLEIARHFGVSLTDVAMVGDTLRDLQAAVAAGARPVLVLTGYGERTRDEGGLPAGTQVFADLAAFALHLVPDSELQQRYTQLHTDRKA